MYRHWSSVLVPKSSRFAYLLRLLSRTSTSETIDWGSVIAGGLHYHFASARKRVAGRRQNFAIPDLDRPVQPRPTQGGGEAAGIRIQGKNRREAFAFLARRDA